MGTRVAAVPMPAPRRPRLAARRRVAFSALVLALMFLLCAPFFADVVARNAPQPIAGSVSYAGWGPLDAPVEVGGVWRLVWRGGGGIAPGTATTARVPGPWTDSRLPDGRAPPATGIASFAVILRDLPSGNYTLYVPIVFAADRVIVNGRVASAHGVIGRDAASTRYEIRSHEIALTSTGAPIALQIDVAAFRHRDTGLGDAPVLGLAGPMRSWIALEWAKGLLFHSALLLLAANSFIAFLFRREDRASLYIALAAALSIPGSAVIGYDNLLLITLPGLSFAAMLAIQYLCSDFAVVFFLFYTRALFPDEAPPRVFWGLQALNFLYAGGEVLFFLLGDTRTASQIAMYWPAVSGVTFLGIIAIVVRAALRRRDGAVIFLLGLVVFTTLFLNAALAWSGLVPPHKLLGTESLPLGMLMLLFSHFVIAAERWSQAIVAAEVVNGDLRELVEVSSAVTSTMELDTLLRRIIETTSRIVNADRSSLLLHDPATGELCSTVAEGLATRELRFPAEQGLAGAAFTRGEVINVTDAYADPRFQRAIDIETGYQTSTILTMPVAARDGRRLGVMQALNRRDGRPFDAKDIERMAAFAAQAAIALDNATLFQQVVASRNYNESILRSMSSGVVTLDRDASVAKLNVAAGRMLGIAPEALEGVDARALLAETNPWLLAEVDQVIATGEPKLLLDHDMTAGGGMLISVNVSIVPLMAEGEPAGLLLLLEDISEGKRLQGAMRRFMTQKVVDQVLARQDDLLFGTACDASVLFADIRNFTSMAEKLSPRETVDMLNEAFTDFFEAVSAWDGVLDKFIGDAIMAVYGAPLPTGRDPENAVESGIQMLRLLGELNVRRDTRALPPLRLGIGVATGEVVAGTIGSPKRMDYTVIGDSVNLAARLQDLTKVYGVEMLVCERTAAAIAGRHPARELDLILVRGRQRPSKIFQIFPADAACDAAVLAAYACGRERLAARDWRGAGAAFAQVAANDAPSRLMLARARQLAENPPPQSWNGVWSAAGGAAG